MSEPVVLNVPYVPISLNKLLRSHWSVKAREKKNWSVQLLMATADHPAWRKQLWSVDKELVRVEVEVHHSRLFDEDNLHGACKPLFDAIVSHGWAYDDRPAFMERKVTQVKSKRNAQFTVVRISRA